jgi:hypothetical protein
MRTREFLHEVMSLAWQFVKRNGYTMSEAMKVAWANLKLKGEMKKKIVKFYFKKVDGSVREEYLFYSQYRYTRNIGIEGLLRHP